MQNGDKFGELTVVSDRYRPDPTKYPYFVDCTCSCGSGVRSYRCVSLTKKNNPTRSCGCLQRKSASKLKTEVCVNQRFGLLIITEDLGMVSGRRFVKASCDCGSETSTRYDQILNGHTKSCGCLQKAVASEKSTTHGMSGTPEHTVWVSMKQRCNNPNSPSYENYGGRGITYDPSWEKFENFFSDMGERPEGKELDRIDVDKGYSKSNCRWVDSTVQSHNQRKRENTTSKYVGVYFDQSKGRWVARIHHYLETYWLGSFLTEEEAAKAYDKRCQELYGVTKNFKQKE